MTKNFDMCFHKFVNEKDHDVSSYYNIYQRRIFKPSKFNLKWTDWVSPSPDWKRQDSVFYGASRQVLIKSRYFHKILRSEKVDVLDNGIIFLESPLLWNLDIKLNINCFTKVHIKEWRRLNSQGVSSCLFETMSPFKIKWEPGLFIWEEKKVFYFLYSATT